LLLKLNYPYIDVPVNPQADNNPVVGCYPQWVFFAILDDTFFFHSGKKFKKGIAKK